MASKKVAVKKKPTKKVAKKKVVKIKKVVKNKKVVKKKEVNTLLKNISEANYKKLKTEMSKVLEDLLAANKKIMTYSAENVKLKAFSMNQVRELANKDSVSSDLSLELKKYRKESHAAELRIVKYNQLGFFGRIFHGKIK